MKDRLNSAYEFETKYLILFVDIIYGALLGYSFEIITRQIDTRSTVSLLLVLLIDFMMCDDWYGVHYGEVGLPYYPPSLFFFHFFEMLYFLLLLYGAYNSNYIVPLLLPFYFLKGAIWDKIIVRELERLNIRGFLREDIKFWLRTASIMSIIYAIIFLFYLILCVDLTIDAIWFIILSLPWLIWRIILEIKSPK